MKVLITGFEPFGGESLNPSWEAVRQLPDNINAIEIIKLEIPTVFGKSAIIIEEAIQKLSPDVVICVGQAGGRSGITPERVAINVDDAKIPDNEGNQPIDKVIQYNGANAYFANLPIKAIVEALTNEGISASVSNSAGTFVCNHCMYNLLYLVNTKYNNIRGGFVHVPYIKEQGNTPYMELIDIVKGLEICIQTCFNTRIDKPLVLGEIC